LQNNIIKIKIKNKKKLSLEKILVPIILSDTRNLIFFHEEVT